MLRKRSVLIAAPIAAVALTLAVAGYQATAAGSSSSGGAGRAGKATGATAPCLAGATTLVGDLDGDGHPDKITNPGHTGTKMTIQWGAADGSFGEKQAVSKLLGAKKGEVASAAVADFQNDGTLDMVVNLVEPSGGDDSSTARVAEYRPGPLKRANLSSAGSRHSDIGDHGEVQQLRIANYGDDAYPDLAILNNPGDGQLDRDVRLSRPKSGPGNYDYELMQKYGEYASTAEPPAMPSDGWTHFYKPCS
ncbi:VCBS repeat-containing protein [Streptomyces sp. NBS 14/10]|uniref:FG-GAP repeat domain-containing protein n=1 Tax=Streptomyces sp. NBS 14/10 TaxID=1945643 RepID=UPI000B7EE172|nr:VCBS repeat-containing protein [Streptomyces sp. NBS 14/10]KAK1180582.1 VCBS repeat-containing protein [Streptomyces sp. NBS 14/10]NUS87813.1 VCBS repeat-containing protein [Streptomyces sp.]